MTVWRVDVIDPRTGYVMPIAKVTVTVWTDAEGVDHAEIERAS